MTRPSRSNSATRPSSRTASRTPRLQDGPASIRSWRAAGSTGPSGPCRRNAPIRASAAQKTPSATTKIRSGRSRLPAGASGFGDGGCSIGLCMGSFRLVFWVQHTQKHPPCQRAKGPGTHRSRPFPRQDFTDWSRSEHSFTVAQNLFDLRCLLPFSIPLPAKQTNSSVALSSNPSLAGLQQIRQ